MEICALFIISICAPATKVFAEPIAEILGSTIEEQNESEHTEDPIEELEEEFEEDEKEQGPPR